MQNHYLHMKKHQSQKTWVCVHLALLTRHFVILQMSTFKILFGYALSLISN